MRSYRVNLNQEERLELQKLVSSGVAPARKIRRARILLGVHGGMNKAEVAQTLGICVGTMTNVCQAFQSQRLGAIERKDPAREYAHCLDGDAEAHLMALACSAAPEGQVRWTLRLLQAEMVKRQYVEQVSHETIRSVLKKRSLSPG
jgi:transposase